ncbi:MAG: hypothetical protein ACI9OJ_005826 [Myxococcota bacterium]
MFHITKRDAKGPESQGTAIGGSTVSHLEMRRQIGHRLTSRDSAARPPC